MIIYPKPVFFFLVSLFAISLISSTTSVPFIILPGLDEICSTPKVAKLTQDLTNWSGNQGFCLEAVSEKWQSWIVSLTEQVNIVCNKVKSIPELSQGYNIIGLSQGNMVGRGLIEFCDNAPPVKKFIGLAGPHAGIATMPYCEGEAVCSFVDQLLKGPVYNDFVQDNLAPTNFIRIPTELDQYLKGCKFLPTLNNEIATKRNPIYKQRFSSLEKLVLVMFENDVVLKPRETSWFGYFKDGSLTEILSYNETRMYAEDWFGLKTLDEAKKIDFISVPGGHLDITNNVKSLLLPYLKNEQSYNERVQGTSFTTWISSKWKSFSDLFSFK